MAIRDDGIGCNGRESYGRGLPIMKKRAGEVGGTVSLSCAGKGTEVNVQVPFPVVYHDVRTDY